MSVSVCFFCLNFYIGDNRLSEALLELEQSQKRFRDVSNRLREAENALDIARASANAAPSFDGGAFDIPAPPGGGESRKKKNNVICQTSSSKKGPPPPPPPPPPPASGINTAPLKVRVYVCVFD